VWRCAPIAALPSERTDSWTVTWPSWPDEYTGAFLLTRCGALRRVRNAEAPLRRVTRTMGVQFQGVNLYTVCTIALYRLILIFPFDNSWIHMKNELSSRARARQKDAVTRLTFQPRCAEGADLCRDWKQSLPNDLYAAYTLETGLPIRWVYVRSVYPELEFSFIFQ
jgi:hypothetical protein